MAMTILKKCRLMGVLKTYERKPYHVAAVQYFPGVDLSPIKALKPFTDHGKTPEEIAAIINPVHRDTLLNGMGGFPPEQCLALVTHRGNAHCITTGREIVIPGDWIVVDESCDPALFIMDDEVFVERYSLVESEPAEAEDAG